VWLASIASLVIVSASSVTFFLLQGGPAARPPAPPPSEASGFGLVIALPFALMTLAVLAGIFVAAWLALAPIAGALLGPPKRRREHAGRALALTAAAAALLGALVVASALVALIVLGPEWLIDLAWRVGALGTAAR
jgi:hypothetical protein